MEAVITEIRKELGIPDTASFLGWLVYNKSKDDFLQDYGTTNIATHKYWCLIPDIAKRFKTFNEANLIMEKLEMDTNVIAVAAFDIGNQILISEPE